MRFSPLHRSPRLRDLFSEYNSLLPPPLPIISAYPFLLSIHHEEHDFISNPSPTPFFKANDTGRVYANCDMIVQVSTPLKFKRRVVKGEEVLRVKRRAHDIILRAPFSCNASFAVLASQCRVVQGVLLVKFLIVSIAHVQKFSEYDLEDSVSTVPNVSPGKRHAPLQVPSPSPLESQPTPSPPESPSSTKTAILTPSPRSLPQSRSTSLESFVSHSQNLQSLTNTSKNFELHPSASEE